MKCNRDIKLISFIKLTNNDSLIKAMQINLNNIIIDYDKTFQYFITFYEVLFNKIIKFNPYHRLYDFVL